MPRRDETSSLDRLYRRWKFWALLSLGCLGIAAVGLAMQIFVGWAVFQLGLVTAVLCATVSAFVALVAVLRRL